MKRSIKLMKIKVVLLMAVMSISLFSVGFSSWITVGSDTISLDFVSDEITNNNIWTQDLTVADNDRITYLNVDPSTFEIDAGVLRYTNKDFTPSVSLDGYAGTQKCRNIM